MASSVISWGRNPVASFDDPNDKLFLRGDACTIYEYDEKAMFIDQGKHLIPWMGDESIMIDRYDVRTHLHDLKLYEPKSQDFEDPLAEEEKMCDEERYRSLRSDVSEELLYQEEELKRLRAAVASDGAYHEIAFTYDDPETDKYVEPPPKVEEPEDELYEVPGGLTVPKGMEVPSNMKIHTIIEKTAVFVSQQGGQMEIIIKMKQGTNPLFAFMNLDNPLYPYYKHLVKVIKSGAYKPIPTERKTKSEDEDDDGHYLHPSLMSGRQEDVLKVPNLNFRRSHDDSYSVLVRNLQQHRKDDTASPQQDSGNNSNEESENTTSSDEENSELKQNSEAFELIIIPPPPDLQPVIDKMAVYVAKNGEDFETIVKSKKDGRFEFLNPQHKYYQYYIKQRNIMKAKMKAKDKTVSHKIENTVNQNAVQTDVFYQHQKPVVQESGPVLYSKVPPSNTNPPKKSSKPTIAITVPTKEEYDSLNPQDEVPAPEIKPSESPKSNTSNSSNSQDSLSQIEKNYEEESKPVKVLKGPISFSLKAKDLDTSSDKAKLTPLLMDDSDDDNSEENKLELEMLAKRKKSPDLHESNSPEATLLESETKVPKPNSEFLEAKQAEERIRDKLLNTARERLAQQKKEAQLQQEQQKREEQLKKEKQEQLEQQRKEKRLQLERKRKAELFLKMLKSKNPDSTAVVSHILASDKSSSGKNPGLWNLSDTPDVSVPDNLLSHKNKLLRPKADCSSDSAPEQQSGEEEPISVIGEKLSSDPEAVEEPVLTKVEKKKKKRKHSRSRSRERSRSKRSKTPRQSKDRHRSRSRSRKSEKKKLPAAYALTRSRSRSRSPRRYRPYFNSWNRRR
ncbi:hypothetical protein CEXT_122111 [Caerostris extrusa]|uniref:SURP motif domain-containing protein n=1 Tax=Caerostris extrusa TaxID=172846 RepID=A0AAV4QJZ3_CAEEX|nr:hypothetical protein CEXT_122111 [Caerostris extrusa]